MTDSNLTNAQAYERSEDVGRNHGDNPTLGDMIASRFARRDVLRGALGVAAIAAIGAPPEFAQAQISQAIDVGRYAFEEIAAGVDEHHHVAPGHDANVLIRWGDPVVPGAPVFDPMAQSAAAQRQQFGYNNDYLAFLPIPTIDAALGGLLVVNHEYTNVELMFPGFDLRGGRAQALARMTPELTAIEMAAHGGSVIEIARDGGPWRVVSGSRYARRIHAETPMEITGPAAGHARLTTKDDPTGRRVLGMINNCAGGVTPWGTWLSCEENFHGYFSGKIADNHPEARNHRRYGVASVNFYGWGRFHERFDIGEQPNETNRFGWVVEIDPLDPTSTPKKRTALGRLKHEGAAGATAKDGRYVVYLGDDERFEYIYRFVTARMIDHANPAANRDLLDDGTLSVACYNSDGTVDWLALIHGQGPLTEANGFASQADVLIEARRAGDLLGATRMDRPEDVEANPQTQSVYVVLTSNDRRSAAQLDAANPRAANRFGHIIEMIPPDGDHAAARFHWDILLQCGEPAAGLGATFSPETTKDGWFGTPDNIAFDHRGRLWVATDGNSTAKTGRADGIWGVETDGVRRGTSKHFFRVPRGAEMCGPYFAPDDETLFVAVQHPGEADDDDKGPPATFENPSTRWPDFQAGMPPRPSVVAIRRRGGGRIG